MLRQTFRVIVAGPFLRTHLQEVAYRLQEVRPQEAEWGWSPAVADGADFNIVPGSPHPSGPVSNKARSRKGVGRDVRSVE